MNKDKKSDLPPLPPSSPDPEDGSAKIGTNNPELGEIYQRLYPEMKRPKPNQQAIAAALQAMQRLTLKTDSELAAEHTAAPVAPPTTPCHTCGHRNREGNRFCANCGAPLDGAEIKPLAVTTAIQPPLEMNASSLSSPISAAVSEVPLTTPIAEPAFDPESQSPEPETPPVAVAGFKSVSDAPDAMAPANPAAGDHHYHHHYHHHYFPAGGTDPGAPLPRTASPESVREADRLRVVAAAKGEPISRSEAAVRRLTQEWMLAINTRQLDELLDLYSPDALVLRSNLPLLRGAAQVREFFFSALESGLGEVALEPVRVEVLGDVAHEVGRYSALVPGNTGKRREERGKYLWVFAKQSGGEWKLVSECWSSDLTLTNAESDLPRNLTSSAVKTAPRK